MFNEHKKIHTKVTGYLWVMSLGGRGKRGNHSPLFTSYIYVSFHFITTKHIFCNKQPSKVLKRKRVPYITSHQSEWPSLKNLQTIYVGESVEKRETSYTVGGNVN